MLIRRIYQITDILTVVHPEVVKLPNVVVIMNLRDIKVV